MPRNIIIIIKQVLSHYKNIHMNPVELRFVLYSVDVLSVYKLCFVVAEGTSSDRISY